MWFLIVTLLVSTPQGATKVERTYPMPDVYRCSDYASLYPKAGKYPPRKPAGALAKLLSDAPDGARVIWTQCVLRPPGQAPLTS